ncbi:unnamed protein product [Ectocarpus sp. 6 AP-2014]
MYKKLFDRVVVGGDLGGLPAIEQFDPRFWQALQSVLEVKSKERVMYNGPATEDASRASILATEVSALRKAHSKRMSWRRWDAKVGDQVVQARERDCCIMVTNRSTVVLLLYSSNSYAERNRLYSSSSF